MEVLFINIHYALRTKNKPQSSYNLNIYIGASRLVFTLTLSYMKEKIYMGHDIILHHLASQSNQDAFR